MSSSEGIESRGLFRIQKGVRDTIYGWVDWFFQLLFFWEHDPKRRGRLIRFVHQLFMSFVILWFFLVHSFAPSFVNLFLLFCLCGILWLHHIVTGTCIVTRLELKLIGDNYTIIDPFLELFHIPIQKETRVGFTLMVSTFCVLFMGLECLARAVAYWKSWFGH